MGARKSKHVMTRSNHEVKGRRSSKMGSTDLNYGIPEFPEPDPRPKTVPFPSLGNIPRGDGLDLFDLNPSRRIKTLTEMTERCWYALDLVLEGSASSAPPTALTGHALVPVPQKTEMYMIGGGNKGRSLAQIWKIKYSGNEQWKIGMSTCALPCPGRYNFFCGLNKDEDKIWIFGGSSANDTSYSSKNYNNISYIDLEEGQFQEVIPRDEDFQRFGLLDTYTQSQSLNQKPCACSQGNNSCIVDLKGSEYLVVSVDLSELQTLFLDTNFNESRDIMKIFMLNTSTLTWTSPSVSGSIPPRVQGHGMVAVGSKVYLFSGMNFSRKLYEDFFFVIDLEPPEVKWSKICDKEPKPGPRTFHGMTAKGKDIYVFGGLGQQGSLSDLWKYDTEANKWSLIDPGMVTTLGQKLYQIQPCHNMAMTILTLDMPAKHGEDLEKCDILVVNGGMNMIDQMFDNFWIFPLFIPNPPKAKET